MAGVTTLVSSVVAVAVSGGAGGHLASRWRSGRVPDVALLAWAIGLGTWAVAGVALTVGMQLGWNAPVVHIMYLCHAAVAGPWLAVGVVAHNGEDRATSRMTGLALTAVVALSLPDILAANRPAVMTAVLAGLWAVVLLDGQRQRVVVGSLLLVAGWSALAAITILPSPSVGSLPAEGVPVASDVLAQHLVAFGRAGTVVASVVTVVGALVGLARGVLANADGTAGDRATRGRTRALVRRATWSTGWQGLANTGRRGRAVAGTVVATGVVVATWLPGLLGMADVAVVVAVTMAVGAAVVHGGALLAVGPRGVGTPVVETGPVTRVWD